MSLRILFFALILASKIYASGLDVYGVGLYDVKFDGSSSDDAIDFRYERRFDRSILDIGPKEENFFFLKPFIGFETTSDSAVYVLTGIYLQDNLGDLIINKKNNYLFTPSFGVGYYDDGSGKKLGNSIEFRTSLEFSYILENNNRIGISLSHISNANIGNKNPGVEIINLSYQIPF
tara:strand:+ start:8493 stop:9020 length:528 start_codon:yes stop_codon:yes gene_type:complete